LGKPAGVDQAAASLGGFAAAGNVLQELQQHLGVHGIDFTRQALTVGAAIYPDETGDGISRVSSDNKQNLATAQYFLKETQRPPYGFA
ncbi:MAG: hypothetical protein ABIZ04_09440, partial [Opitutus sp.]